MTTITALTTDIALSMPEIFLVAMALLLTLLGAFIGNKSTRLVSVFAILVFMATALELVTEPRFSVNAMAFQGLFVSDLFAVTMKILCLIGLAMALMISLSALRLDMMERFEYPILIMLSGVGMMVMLSANHFLTLYVGLELSSLALYVLAAFRRETLVSAEAGMKYFILGALSSGMLLFGISLIYGFAGTLNFNGIHDVLISGASVPPGLIVGMVFVLAGLAFKISAVPFHMWVPDVYQGAPGAVTALFAMVPKIAAMGVLIRLLMGPFASLQADWVQIVIFVSVASMLWGAFAAVSQTNIKRVLAYASIANIGYGLLGLIPADGSGLAATVLYLGVYLMMTAGVFAVFLALRREGTQVEEISDFAGLSRTHPILAYALALLLFAMAGIPPLAGFFSKLMVLEPVVAAGFYSVAIIGIVASVVAAYYYLKIIRVMFFDKPQETLDARLDGGQQLVVLTTLLFVLIFILSPQKYYDLAAHAVSVFHVVDHGHLTQELPQP